MTPSQLLKRSLDNAKRYVIMTMGIKINELEPCDDAHNAKFPRNFCRDIKQYFE
jgi:hypothetical protein